METRSGAARRRGSVVGCRIVVVDDEPAFLDIAQSLLAAQPGVRVVGTASSGQEAIDLVPELEPELVILDVQMPGMSGFETARRLVRSTNGVRVVMVSAHDEPQYEAIAMAAGASGFLTKKSFLSDGIGRFLS
jgi:DNA-binding NarL/FixJ family response regulator